MKKISKLLGFVLLLAGIVLFLIASIGFQAAKEDPTIEVPKGMTVELPKDNPERVRREKIAEDFLMYSVGSGATGIVLLIVGFALKTPQQKQIEK